MKIKAISGIILILLLVSMSTLAFNLQLVRAEPAPIISVYPPTNSVAPGGNFTVAIIVTGITASDSLYMWEVKINFNPSILETSRTYVRRGPFLRDAVSPYTYTTIYQEKVDNDLGVVNIGETVMAKLPPDPPYPPVGAVGNGTLAIITFLVKAEGATLLHFEEGRHLLYTIKAATPVEIGHEANDGIFDNRAGSPPVALFDADPPVAEVNQTIRFNASASYDPDAWLVSYEWDFGDNTTEIYKDENITHITAHAFDQGGTYTVKLTVTDNDGLTSTATARITVIQAEPTPTISVYPSISTALVGEIFTVNITVTDIVISETPPVSKGLFGWEAWMTFDSDVLHAVNATEGPFLESAGYPTLWLSRINNTEGTVRVGATIQFWNPPYPENGSVGSGVLATLTFEVVSEGKTSLHFETPIDVAKTNLYTIIANNVAKLLFTAEDGLFLSAPAPEIFVWPPISMAEVGQTLTININITNVTWENSNDSGVYGWQFYMSFDPEVLNATSVMEGPWLKSTGEETLFAENIFNEEGYLIAINFLIDFPDTGVVGSGTLANVTFDVLDTGTCPLDLYQTKLRTAWEIEPGIWDVFAVDHTAVGGFFTSLLRSPVASFTWEPEAPSVGETVTFDASASYDPDGTIVSWNWSFGDDTFGSGMIVDHVYASGGNYNAILAVIDNEGLNDTSAAVVTVSPVGVHDIAVASATAYPTEVTAGEFVTITGTVVNEGDFSEIFSLTVYYDSTMISAYNATLDAGGSTTWAFTWDTTVVPSGTYTIRAEAIVVEGEVDTSDNMLVDGTVTVASPPAPLMLSIKLCGEHDYAIMENVKVRLAALVKDAATMEPVSDADVTIEIYGSDGVLWVSDVMVEKLAGTGIYEWESEGTIRELRLAKGVYLVHVQASHQGGPIASDILEFHIDPPAGGTNQTLYHVAFTAVALVGLTGLILKRQKIANRLRKLKRHN